MSRLLERCQTEWRACSRPLTRLITPTAIITAACGVVCTGTLIADFSFDLGMMVALPYVLCVTATLWMRSRWSAPAIACVVSFACLLGLVLGNSFSQFPVTQRLLVLFAIWATAGIVVMRRSFYQELDAHDTLLGVVADQAPVMIWMSDREENRSYYNAQWLSFVGSTLEQEIEQDPFERVHPEDYDRCFDLYVDALENRAPFQLEYRLLCHDGEYCRVLDTACPRFSPNGHFEGYVGFAKDLTDRMRSERSLRGRSLALEKIASRRELDEILTTLVETAESVSPDLRCAIAIVDETESRFESVTGAGMPTFYRIILTELEIGPESEALGQSISRRQRVIIEDVMSHPDWEPYRDYAKRADFRTCWAEPIIASDGKPLGSIGVFFRRSRVPDWAELEFIRAAASMAAIAIEGTHDWRQSDLAETKRALEEARQFVEELEHNLEEIKRSSGRDVESESGTEEVVAPAPKPRRAVALVIDSSDSFLFSVTELLESHCSLSSAENGPLAINMVKSSLRRGAPYDVILVNMDAKDLEWGPVVHSVRDEGYLGTIVGLVSKDPEVAEPLLQCVGGNVAMQMPIRWKELSDFIESHNQRVAPASETSGVSSINAEGSQESEGQEVS